jgi:exopolyphosphatase/guanosine-5'-triphosphate,3'-diphosphate pyrophosphatase
MLSPASYPKGGIVAFIDIGTTSLRLLLVRINPNASFTILSDQKEMVRLGEGEFADQHLQPEAIQRAVLVAKRFADMARSYNAVEIITVATSATREAGNKDEFLRRLNREAMLDVRVVSGREEARLIYLGVANSVHLADQQAVFIDIGGGSTEIIIGGQDQYHHLDSLKLGAIRLHGMFFLPDESGPVMRERYELIRQYVRNAAVRAIQKVTDAHTNLAFGSSGTIENLADIATLKFYKRRRQRDDVLTYDQLKDVIAMLCALPLQERRRIPGINFSRADIIIAGAAIIDTLMAEMGIEELHISDRGLRDGLLIDYLSRKEHIHMLEGTSVRARSVLQLGRACGIDEAHAHHVAQLALELFDSSYAAGLHRFGQRERELLEHAAMLHDVGTFLSYNNHHQHSYYLIRNADLLGFDQGEIDILANAGLFHRKAMPSKKKHADFAALDKHSQRVVRLFALLLRIAESLDRSHSRVVQHVQLNPLKDGRFRLELQATGDCQLELWGVQTHAKAFQQVFRNKYLIEPVLKNGAAIEQILPAPDSGVAPVG